MWLEKMIFGTSLKCRSLPSHLKCQKVHCTSNCKNSYYTNILSEKKLSKISLIKSHFPNDLRISIWYRLINRPVISTYKVKVMEDDRKLVECIFEFCENERDVFEVYKCVMDVFGKVRSGEDRKDNLDQLDKDKLVNLDNSDDSDNVTFDNGNINSGNETIKKNGLKKDNDLATSNEKSKRNNLKKENESDQNVDKKKTDNNNKKDNDKKSTSTAIENTPSSESDDTYGVKTVLTTSHNNTLSTQTTNNIYTSDNVDIDLLHLINYILDLPNCTKDLGYSILYTMFDRLQFDLIYFSPESFHNMKYKDMKKKITQLIRTNSVDYLFDRVFIYGPNSLIKLFTITKGFSEREIDNACKELKVKEIIPVVEERKDEEYFDFLVVQNEVAKAQEGLKKQLVTKIEELYARNKELELRNANLKSNVDSLEENMKCFESKYVEELKAMLSSVRSQNDHLQKENEVLKKKEVD